jgi:hypothetical protein
VVTYSEKKKDWRGSGRMRKETLDKCEGLRIVCDSADIEISKCKLATLPFEIGGSR